MGNLCLIFCRYALELLRFREAGVEVVLKASCLINLHHFVLESYDCFLF